MQKREDKEGGRIEKRICESVSKKQQFVIRLYPQIFHELFLAIDMDRKHPLCITC